MKSKVSFHIAEEGDQLAQQAAVVPGLSITEAPSDRYLEVLNTAALELLVELERRFRGPRQALLQRRAERQEDFDKGLLPDFLPETKDIREAGWSVASAARARRCCAGGRSVKTRSTRG